MWKKQALSILNPFQRCPIYLTLHKILDSTIKKEEKIKGFLLLFNFWSDKQIINNRRAVLFYINSINELMQHFWCSFIRYIITKTTDK
ncbi:hypothetical protein CX649_00765 [Bacillaceae bacterium ZC4]|nr:hypothetical protein CX649_00765 [Bacillaceae bacterium ZC4]REJ22991.1 MAG: hypothetical protein C6W54_13180 [Bacillaceae bacterium]